MMLVLRTLARKPQTKIALFSERISISLKKDYEFRCFSQLYAGYIHVLPHKKSPSRLASSPLLPLVSSLNAAVNASVR